MLIYHKITHAQHATINMKIPDWIKIIKNPEISQKNYLPIYAPVFLGNEKKYLLKCIDDGWISPKGKFILLFEKAFADFCNAPFSLTCSSGTAALQLGLVSLGIKKGDKVIVPSFTMISTALALSHIGAIPIFADCRLDTGNMGIQNLTNAYSYDIKAVIPVDIYGCADEYDEILRFASERNLKIVEDAAEAFGSVYKNTFIGNVCPVTAFSLYINKVITTGQGGMLTTKSKKIYKKLKKLNNYYFSQNRHFWHSKIGYNYRMSNLQAAVGLSQIERIDVILKKKRIIALWYKSRLKNLSDYIIPMNIPKGIKSNYWQIAWRLRKIKYDVNKLRNILGSNGIETRSFFIPLHLQPPYFKKYNVGLFPNSEILAQTGLLLPSGPSLHEADVERICSIIRNYFKK